MRITILRLLQGFLPVMFLLGAEGADVDVQRIIISNRCPISIPIYINGKLEGKLVSGLAIWKTYKKDWNGLIHTTANGGTISGQNSTKAGFQGLLDYYYVAQDPSYFNVGISITPRIRENVGFCTVASCDSAKCGTSFSPAPNTFPGLSPNPPALPLHACRISKPKYTVTFCPSRALPAGQDAVRIHPNGNAKKCLEVRGGVLRNGTPVQIHDCNNTPAQSWVIKRGLHTAVQIAGTNFCLDAGADATKLTNMKIWQCFKGFGAQTWSYGADNLVRRYKTESCLDLAYGITSNANQVQTYHCDPTNTNQVWTTSQ